MKKKSRKRQRHNQKFEIRFSTRKDIEILVSHRRKMWQEVLRRRNGRKKNTAVEAGADTRYRQWILKTKERRRFFGLIVFSKQHGIATPAGSGGIWLREVQPGPFSGKAEQPYLLSMYTEPEFRGNGVATLIVKKAMNWCKKKGYRSMSLHASRMGRPVYRKLGWERSWEMRRTLTSAR